MPRLRTELRSLRMGRLWVAYATTGLTVAANFAIFSYLGALLEDVTGISTGLVPALLALYGLGALGGLMAGGRTADRAPFTTLLVGTGGVAVASVLVTLAAGSVGAMVALVFVLGLAGFLTNPVVSARAFGILGETRTLGGAVNIAAFNVGITLAPIVSGLVIGAGLGLAATGWVAAAFALAAAGTTLWDRRLTRRHRATTAPSAPSSETAGSGAAAVRCGESAGT
ncbi:MFS transporter [Streptomyces sp. NPDC059894]|uniref:MFS transporter n=1 Tax=unclassified Streptomyces TaxID=2593676 RepID=UPI003661FB5A